VHEIELLILLLLAIALLAQLAGRLQVPTRCSSWSPAWR
jgi:hypothetical protein